MEAQASPALPKELNQKYEDAIRRNLDALMRSHGVSQTQLVAELESRGLSVNQGNLSLILSGRKHIPLSIIVHLCDYFHVSLAELVDEDLGGARQVGGHVPLLYADDLLLHVPSLGDAFVTDPSRQEFQGYLQTYHVYLKPTVSSGRTLHTGLLTLEASGSVCEATLELYCDEKADGQQVCKLYHGRVIISTAVDAVYVLLTSPIEGELSVLCFRHYHLPHRPLDCRIAAVLTNESGEFHAPTMSRMFLSRTPIEAEHLPLLIPHLYLNSGDITVRGTELETLRQESEEYRELIDQLTRFKPIETYYWPEAYVKGISKLLLEEGQVSVFLSRLRGISQADPRNKVSHQADLLARNLLLKLGYYQA